MENGLIRYTIPRKVEIPKEDRPDQNKYFTDELTKRKRADKYTGVIGRKEKPFSKMPVYKQQYVLMGTKT